MTMKSVKKEIKAKDAFKGSAKGKMPVKGEKVAANHIKARGGPKMGKKKGVKC
jgi:hypothetical protein